MKRKGLTSFCVPLLRNWYKRTKKLWKENTADIVDNTVNDLRYENKFENPVKYKKYFFIKRNIFLSNQIFFK